MITKLTRFQLFSIAVVSLGGFLFGYSLAVISGALKLLVKNFALSDAHEGIIVAAPILGTLFGSSCAGYLADRLGRRRTLIVTSVLFILGALITAIAPKFGFLLSGRLLVGFAVGIVSLIAPLYLSEIAPPALRGEVVAVNTLMIAIGIFVAYLVNAFFFKAQAWRPMFALAILPAALQFFGLFFIRETRAFGDGAKEEKSAWHVFFKPNVRLLLFIGVMLSVFQQITGINAVIFYAPKILEKAGFEAGSITNSVTLGIGLVNILATFVAVKLLDRFGRRPLLFIGIAGAAISLLAVSTGFLFHLPFLKFISSFGLMSYIAFFSLSLGPITWLIIAEIYPLSIRGRAMSIATFANWLSCFVISLTFPAIFRSLGMVWTFFLFAILSMLAFVFVWRYVPETKGKSLEEIEAQLTATNFKKGG